MVRPRLRRLSILKAVVAVIPAILLAACATPPAPGSAACVPKALAHLAVQFLGNEPTVAVDLDGHPVTMVLDLGSQATVLADATADRLDLARDPSALPNITGVGGSGTRWAATARHMTLGGMTLSGKRMEVAQIGLGGASQPINGAIGLDTLLRYDIDWDLPHNEVTLNAPSGCAGPPAGWASPAATVPLRHPGGMASYRQQSGLLLLPVAVDQRPMTALLDSGAAISLMNADTAAALEPSGNSGDKTVRVRGAGSGSLVGTLHRFRSLTVAGYTMANPLMVVAAVPLDFGDMILGVGFMRTHRAWLPAGGGRIWFGPYEPPQPAATPPAAPSGEMR